MVQEFHNGLRIGMLGLGTVGAGTYRVLLRNQNEIVARAGKPIAIVMVAVRNLQRAAAVVGPEVTLTQDPFAVVNHPDIDVVVEVMGGTTLARDLVLQAIARGKHVVTANKALLAEHGEAIFAAASEQGVVVAYEAAVAVSIPIIKALREGLVANRIAWVAGIVNGTSNFILSEMRNRGIAFAAALADAQSQGFAEADPRFDVDGIDAAHKISLLAANAFGCPIPFADVQTEGIADMDALDMAYAERLGYRVKLLALAVRRDEGLEVRVHPALLPVGCLMASVDGSMNAVMVHGDASGSTLYYGAGAGSETTASAVIADLVDVARSANAHPSERVPPLAFQEQARAALPLLPPSESRSGRYLRVNLRLNIDGQSEVEVEAAIWAVLAEAGVVVRAQHRFAQADGLAHWVFITQPVSNRVWQPVLHALACLPGVHGRTNSIRMEALG